MTAHKDQPQKGQPEKREQVTEDTRKRVERETTESDRDRRPADIDGGDDVNPREDTSRLPRRSDDDDDEGKGAKDDE
jgi:hypothetical protein